MANQTVEQVLKSIPHGEGIYYRSNPGNAGDALIALGTIHLLDDLGIPFRFIDSEPFDADDRIVVYAGGGNLNHLYTDARQFIQRYHTRPRLFILLPHTITGNEDLLSQFGANVILFARERVTYEHIQAHAKTCACYLDHDMAMHIKVGRTRMDRPRSLLRALGRKIALKIIGQGNNDSLPSIKKMVQIVRFEQRAGRLDATKHGNFFRRDIESSGRPLPENNADLSVIYELSTRSRDIVEYTADLLLSHLNQYESIATDRLHICLAASLLGKQVFFFGNSYFKCRAVYEYTLRSAFPNVTWQDG